VSPGPAPVASLPPVDLTAEASYLLATYAWAIDAREPSLFSRVFTADVDADYEGFACHGLEELAARLDQLHHGLRSTQHLVGSVLAEPSDPDRAGVRSHVRASLVADGGRRLEVAARYEDELVRGPHGWRIRARRVRGMWMNGDRTILPWMSHDMRAEQEIGRG